MAPLDEAWGVGAGTLTPALARVAARAGLERAFAQGADLVAEAAGVRVEPEVVRAMSESMGHLVEADQQEATAWAVDLPRFDGDQNAWYSQEEVPSSWPRVIARIPPSSAPRPSGWCATAASRQRRSPAGWRSPRRPCACGCGK